MKLVDSNVKPLAIKHVGKPKDGWKQMVQDACRNVRMGARATRLLLYYAGCGNGYTPSAFTVYKETGICSKHLYAVRKDIIARGLMDVDEYILIDWKRMKIFAMLTEPLNFKKGSPERYFSPVGAVDKPKTFSHKPLWYTGRNYIIKHPRELTKDEEDFYEILSNMSEREYVEMVRAFQPDIWFGKGLMPEHVYAKYIGKMPRVVVKDGTETVPMQKIAQDATYLAGMPQDLPF